MSLLSSSCSPSSREPSTDEYPVRSPSSTSRPPLHSAYLCPGVATAIWGSNGRAAGQVGGAGGSLHHDRLAINESCSEHCRSYPAGREVIDKSRKTSGDRFPSLRNRRTASICVKERTFVTVQDAVVVRQSLGSKTRFGYRLL